MILTSQIQILLECCSPPNVLEVSGFWFQGLDPKTVQAEVQSPKTTKKYFPILQKLSHKKCLKGLIWIFFSLLYPIQNDDTDGNKENHQLGDIVLMFHWILKTNIW